MKISTPNSSATPLLRSIPSSVYLPIAGALCITLASQIRIELGFTPVPITGQTFAVVLWGLLFGSRQGALASVSYLVAGAVGLPVFAGFTALPALWGATSGYLIGFIPGAWLAGWLTERIQPRNPLATFGISLTAHLPILIVGSLVMTSFFGFSQLWVLAIAPFLIGDVIKSVAATIVTSTVRNLRRGA